MSGAEFDGAVNDGSGNGTSSFLAAMMSGDDNSTITSNMTAPASDAFPITTDTNLTYMEQLFKIIVITISSLLSIFGSGSIMFFCRQKMKHRLYHRLLFCLSLCDFIFSISYLLQPWLTPNDSPKFERTAIPIPSYGNITTCNVLGFFFTTSALCVSLFNCFLGLYFKLTIVCSKTEIYVIQRYETIWYAMAIIIPLIFGIVTFHYKGYNPENYTRLCTFDGREFGVASYGPLIGYIWVSVLLVATIVGFQSTYQVYKKVRDRSIAMQRYDFSERRTTSSSAEQQQQQQQQQPSSQRNLLLLQQHLQQRSQQILQQQQQNQQQQPHLEPTQQGGELPSLSSTTTEAASGSSLSQENHQRATLKFNSNGTSFRSSSASTSFRNPSSHPPVGPVGGSSDIDSSNRTSNHSDAGSGGGGGGGGNSRPFGVGGFHSILRPSSLVRPSSLMRPATSSRMLMMRRQSSSISATGTNRTTATSSSHVASSNRVKAVATQAVLYSMAYLNSVSWPLLVAIFAGAFNKTTGQMYWLDLLSSAFYPLQGFLNFFVFLRPTYAQYRRMHPKKSRLWTFQQIMEFHSNSSSAPRTTTTASTTASTSEASSAFRRRQHQQSQQHQQNRRRQRNAITQETLTADEANRYTDGSSIQYDGIEQDTKSENFVDGSESRDHNHNNDSGRSSRLLRMEMEKCTPETIDEEVDDDEYNMGDSGDIADDDEYEAKNGHNNHDLISESSSHQRSSANQDQMIDEGDGMDDAVMNLRDPISLDERRVKSQSDLPDDPGITMIANEKQNRRISFKNLHDTHQLQDDENGIGTIKKPKRGSFFGLTNASRVSNRRMVRQSYPSSRNSNATNTSNGIQDGDIDDNGIRGGQRRSSFHSFLLRTSRRQRSSRRQSASEATRSSASRTTSISAFYDLDLNLDENRLQDDFEEDDFDHSNGEEDMNHNHGALSRAMEGHQSPSSLPPTSSISAFYDLDQANTKLDENLDEDGNYIRLEASQSRSNIRHASWSSSTAFSPSAVQGKQHRVQSRSRRSLRNQLESGRASSNSSLFTSLSRMGWSSLFPSSRGDFVTDDPTSVQLPPIQQNDDEDLEESIEKIQQNHCTDASSENQLGAHYSKPAAEKASGTRADDDATDATTISGPIGTGLKFLQNETGFNDTHDIQEISSQALERHHEVDPASPSPKVGQGQSAELDMPTSDVGAIDIYDINVDHTSSSSIVEA